MHTLLEYSIPPILSSPIHPLWHADDFIVDWQKRLDDDSLAVFVSMGFLIVDSVFNNAALQALQFESGFVDYRDALLTNGSRQADIRGDRIRWIDPNFMAGSQYLICVDALAQFFNRTLFAGIRRSEAHYACYPAGFGYQWHQDNPVGRSERVISAVFYLNDDWTLADGGALSLIDHQAQQHQVLPKANRLVIFDSDLRHQVEIAQRQRYSIATWLRRDDMAILP